jgi:hypothetical protein
LFFTHAPKPPISGIKKPNFVPSTIAASSAYLIFDGIWYFNVHSI